MTVVLASLEPLVSCLRAEGYTVVGPTESEGAIVLAELTSAEDLPHGWGVETGPGTYRLRQRADRAAFGHSAGPQAWKRFLHPPREALWSAERSDDGVVFTEAETPVDRYAFLGVRPCDLRAIAAQDRVLGAGTTYAARRRELFLVAVNCTEPSATCFCVSAGGGPNAGAGYDLVRTELTDSEQPRYGAAAGSAAGQSVLDALPRKPALAEVIAQAEDAVAAAAHRMQRGLPEVDLRAMLAGAMEAARWDDVAARCLSCANCTMACPTCFCTSVTDTTDLTGDHAERWQHWASCFEADFSYLHGGSVRTSTRSRYRQWLTHKLGTWHDQFGESGCVGCGRCIAWCPVGIDITVEAGALAQEAAVTS
jgi:formate hydrogenlyase subunit 6/NADH:ubiquinone oxidoreductase subunit I